ncbi:hypothetical protein CRG98_034356 [Punica granatum]|uniref:Uncharacterized protein n=1 Tax=Punica granatum TaxID=22663 RepID=A0A2I0IMK7_PUNGR|nr:hypothetical protein CRG98_034356 [Punica granatum]
MPTTLSLAPQERGDRMGRRMSERLSHHQGVFSPTAGIGPAYTGSSPRTLPNGAPPIIRMHAGCAHPNLISSGHTCTKPVQCGLGVSTFPGTRDERT